MTSPAPVQLVPIDADNTSPRIAAGLFERSPFGEASVRRIYGDFSSPRMRSWADILQRYAIDPYQQFATPPARTPPISPQVIDAMDLLHSRRFDGFCLVSSDSDFTAWPRACARRGRRLRLRHATDAGELPPFAGASSTPRTCCRRRRPRRRRATARLGAPTGECRHSALEQGDRRNGVRGWLDRAGVVGQRLPNFASDFDPPDLRAVVAQQRPRPQDRRLRDRSAGPRHAHQVIEVDTRIEGPIGRRCAAQARLEIAVHVG